MSVFLAAILLQLFLGLGVFLLLGKAKAMSPRLRRVLLVSSGLLVVLTALYLVLTILLLRGVR